MRKTKILLAMLLTSFLSCTSVPTIEEEQCSVFFDFNEDGSINEDGSACFCRMYRFSPESVGPIGQETVKDLVDCDRIIGFYPDGYQQVQEWAEQARQASQQCNQRE